jgi:hypothetical protein
MHAPVRQRGRHMGLESRVPRDELKVSNLQSMVLLGQCWSHFNNG